ncbi:MAG: bifunctional diaminohydroxyphosphoribosylaminopyrimidine deaminase/5-amino-6-(5-phosphoribosylamino)uracil reductase RibD [Candidatus Omnitrophota bacterium]|nr:bifunctional diaminohydroxyphosphoribosylaminopyrimidine deaminase/5-amino-6-(5-phosphoribosylamino)uracil reductase RibD [Candidatus Omnitrophota bacterium]MBU1929545.1 bifunctional diaminohydroxyphosphoribosylaminopyrimidine deaminase/5-amino-6-(5-phosphoribosylamino)uracil reductase RibD [Candidatus Omnitrophota bacterium]MBU2035803.1 bifunctional diaminohydroxyphosphoribosylaminopyrimidine deaminase/5-amino-6-(5-phosphoribosylamino)uracil reductase RibD [Candidatus Omnitrophota bacterium]
MSIHGKYIRIAMKLALKAKGKTSPNPLVGALVVKNNRIIGKGFHQKAGSAHAEVIALDEAGKDAKGASLYVTLEPCVHFGRTPPCVDRIIRSGIREVAIGMIDPNPLNNGKGIDILKRQKIKVEVGFLEEELRRMNEAFIKYITKKIPLVTVKVAQSLDGKIATKSGDSKWITSDKSRGYAHRLRGNYDAIMVGVNTVLRDNPKLDAWYSHKNPVKIVVDSQLSTPQSANIFSKNSQVVIVTLLTQPGQETENRKILAQKAKILDVMGKSGEVNLKDMLRKLARMQIMSVLVEGGGNLIGSLFDDGLVDKVMFFISPNKIIGGKEAISSVMGKGIVRIEQAIKLKEVKLKKMGEDFLIEAYVQRNS